MESEVICFGSIHWDIVGRPANGLGEFRDVPGVVQMVPGGVVCNVGIALKRNHVQPKFLSAVGNDFLGIELVSRLQELGLDTAGIVFSNTSPTGLFVAIEDHIVGDCAVIENECHALLRKFLRGLPGASRNLDKRTLLLDGNLPCPVIELLAAEGGLVGRRIIHVAASTAKARRALPLLGRPNTSLYLNLSEANRLCAVEHEDAECAAKGLVEMGFERAIVTNSENAAADSDAVETLVAYPCPNRATHTIGAGDNFMAAHFAAESNGLDRQAALAHAHNSVAVRLGQD